MQVYHVVTDRPMKCGQHIIFDENHHSGVYERVQVKMEKVHDIYENPDKYDEKKRNNGENFLHGSEDRLTAL